jgi:glycosyltransferase involved in cell wall biosynthesis
VQKILNDEALRAKFSQNSKKIAAQFTEKKQTEKLVELYQKVLQRY